MNSNSQVFIEIQHTALRRSSQVQPGKPPSCNQLRDRSVSCDSDLKIVLPLSSAGAVVGNDSHPFVKPSVLPTFFIRS